MNPKLYIVAHKIGWKVVGADGETLPNAGFFSTRADARTWVRGYCEAYAVVSKKDQTSEETK